METFKNAHIEHLGWTRATYGIAAASYFRWHGEDIATEGLEVENMQEFLAMRIGMGRRQPTVPQTRVPRLEAAAERPSGNVIPGGDGEGR